MRRVDAPTTTMEGGARGDVEAVATPDHERHPNFLLRTEQLQPLPLGHVPCERGAARVRRNDGLR